MTRAPGWLSWTGDPRIRVPLLVAFLLAPVGGLLIALAGYQSSESDDLGLLFTYWYFYVGVGLVLAATGANLAMMRWCRRHPLPPAAP
jgi:hypothetical protein